MVFIYFIFKLKGHNNMIKKTNGTNGKRHAHFIILKVYKISENLKYFKTHEV